MRTQRHVSTLLAAGLALGVVIVGALSVRGRSQDGQGMPQPIQAVCETAKPVAGGGAYLYVVDPMVNVVSVFENGAIAASYQLWDHPGGHTGAYTVCSGSAEPVADGNAYCFVIDRESRKVHAFRDAEYVGTEVLPTEGDKLP